MERYTIIDWDTKSIIETSDPSDPTAGGSETVADLNELIELIYERIEQEETLYRTAKQEQAYYKRIGE